MQHARTAPQLYSVMQARRAAAPCTSGRECRQHSQHPLCSGESLMLSAASLRRAAHLAMRLKCMVLHNGGGLRSQEVPCCMVAAEERACRCFCQLGMFDIKHAGASSGNKATV